MTLTAFYPASAHWIPMPNDFLTSQQAGTLIRRRRLERGLTQDQLVERTGLSSQSYLSALEKGRYHIGKSDHFPAVARELALSEEDIRLINPAAVFAAPRTHAPSAIELSDFVQMPIYALASAGLDAAEVEPLHKLPPLMIPAESWHPALRMFLAVGHSMDSGREDGIRDGDIIHVDLRDVDPVPGRICVVQVPGKGVFVKRIRRMGGSLWLVSDNPDEDQYPAFQAEEACVLGTVCNFTRNVRVKAHLS